MNVNFYSFSKRRNSTKQPTGTGTIIDCKLKEGTSIKNPKLTITGDVFGYNYAYISDFGRYYFINDVISEAKGLTTYVLEEDTLASNKTAIGSTVARIAFSSTGWNKDIIDPRIACETTKLIYSATSSNTLFDNTGCYVMTVFNKVSGASNGMGSCYVMDAANMQKVKNWLGDDAVFAKLTNYFLGNPLDSIFSCIWVPFSIGSNPGAGVGTIYIGNQDSSVYGISAYAVSGTGRVGHDVTVTIPRRNDYGADFRDAEPYTCGQIYLPGIGLLDLNMSDWLNSDKINIRYILEYSTGDVAYFLKDDAGHLIQTAKTNMGALCPLGQVTSNQNVLTQIGGATAGLGQIAAGIVTENPAMILTGAASTALALNTRRGTSISGSNSGQMAAAETSIFYTGYYIDTESMDANYIAQKGRPVAVTHAISNHSGYVQCDDASVSIGGESWERDQINSLLNGGFFYE